MILFSTYTFERSVQNQLLERSVQQKGLILSLTRHIQHMQDDLSSLKNCQLNCSVAYK